MAIQQFHVEGYRSLRRVYVDMKQLNVLVGPNGSGKSNLYRALYLVHACATNQFARELANEGGMASVGWAGRRHKNEDAKVHLEVKFDELEYKMVFGRIPVAEVCTEALSCFSNDPDIKEEEVGLTFAGKTSQLVNRARGMISARNMDGRRVEYPLAVSGRESILSGLRDPQKFPELSTLREEFLNWRFYHQFRTDLESPLRQPQLGVLTPVLSHDGTDLAAALATIRAIGNEDQLNEAITSAFHGATLEVDVEEAEFSFKLQMAEFNRPFHAFELSDGTLQYLCLLAALLTPRPPSFMVFNEPETSIHPDLLEPLAKLFVHASKHTQLLITTHSHDLARFIKKYGRVEPIELERVNGETRLVGLSLTDDDSNDDDYIDDDQDSAKGRGIHRKLDNEPMFHRSKRHDVSLNEDDGDEDDDGGVEDKGDQGEDGAYTEDDSQTHDRINVKDQNRHPADDAGRNSPTKRVTSQSEKTQSDKMRSQRKIETD